MSFGSNACFTSPRDLAVDPLDGAYCHAVLDDDVGHLLVFEAEGLDTRVVAAVELIVDHHTDAEARAEGVAHQVFVAFRAAQGFELGVYLGQGAAQCFAIGEQVAVVVDEYRNAEFVFEEGPQRHAFAERGEIGQVTADDAVGIIGRARECEADGDGFGLQFVDHGLEAFDHRCQAFVEVVRIRRHGDGFDDEFVGLHGSEHEVRTSGIESDDHPVVVSVHGCYLFVGFSIFLRRNRPCGACGSCGASPSPILRLHLVAEPRLPESGCRQVRADWLPLGVGGSVHWLHSVPVFSPAKIVKITERCGLRPESMHVWCDFCVAGANIRAFVPAGCFSGCQPCCFPGVFITFTHGSARPQGIRCGVAARHRALYSGIKS